MTLENEMTAATAFSFTDAFRMVKDLGGSEYDSQRITLANLWASLMAMPDGTMLNGKISPSVASNDLTVALKTHAGNNPSAAEPVLIKINGTWRVCSAALSVTKADATNWFNAGAAELAAKEIDYFAYIIWNTTPATDIVDLGFSRIAGGTVYSDFSGTTTNEKYLAFANASTPTSTDDVVCIGRFAATLSAGAGYTWTVPTFTTKNLIQRPIYETRWLTYAPTIAGYSANPTNTAYEYMVQPGRCVLSLLENTDGTSNNTAHTYTAPFTNAKSYVVELLIPAPRDNNAYVAGGIAALAASSATISVYKSAAAAWTASGNCRIVGLQGFFPI